MSILTLVDGVIATAGSPGSEIPALSFGNACPLSMSLISISSHVLSRHWFV